MRNGTGSAKTLGLVIAGFLGVASFAMNGARAGEPMTLARARPHGQVAAACVAVEDAKAKIDAIIALALKKPMPRGPGTCWSYAHTNFVILGKVLEMASGRQLQDLIREGFPEPLSLNDTRSEMTAIIQAPLLHAFDGERGRYEDSTYWDPSWTLAEGTIMTSNTADILKSAVAIGKGTLVSPQSHAAQLAPETAKFKPWNANA